MPAFNKVILAGNLTRDPEVRYTPKGTAIAQCGMAINHKWRTDEGEDREEVCFVDFTAWGRRAEVIAQYLKKGNPILMEGRLKTDQWEDKTTGRPRQKLTVVLESFTFIGGDGADREERAATSRPSKPETKKTVSATATAEPSDPDNDDDVPF
jgi:single-strand DNA-binding protein